MNPARALAIAALLGLFLPACQAGEPGSGSSADASAGPALVALPPMPTPRAAHSATKLADGRVLLAGGCYADGCEEGISGDALLFDPARGAFSPTGLLVQARVGHRAVALVDGSVLLLGGHTPDGPTAVVERYDPTTGRFAAHGRLREARDGFSATLLADGSVLVVGGYTDGMRRLSSAERYDPATGKSRPVGDMAIPRMSHTASLLADGRVLVAGGSHSRGEVDGTLELFDPGSARFSPAGSLARARHKHAAIAFDDRVLLLGGASIPEADGHFTDSEWWSPTNGVTPGPRLQLGRYKFLDAVARLDDGRSLVAGGGGSAELLDVNGSDFAPVAGDIGAALAFASATTLDDGRVLVAGGYDADIRVSSQAWLFLSTPGANASASRTAD